MTGYKKIISYILLTSVFCFCFAAAGLPAHADAAAEAQLQALQQQRAAIASQVDALTAQLDGLKSQQSDVVSQKVVMDERDAYLLEQIGLNQEELALYESMIEEKAAEVEEAKALEAEQLERYRTRVRAMEENGSYNYFDIIMNCSSLSDLLTAIDDIGEIMESDKNLEDAYIASREATEAVKAEYENVKTEYEGKIKSLEKDQAVLRDQIQEALYMINSLEDDINDGTEQWKLLIAAEEAAAAQINALAAQIAAEQAAARAAAVASGQAVTAATGGAQGTGNLAWPTGSTLITSNFGARSAPTAGASSNHQGIDINANEGDAVMAADGGTVAAAGYNSGYGNYVLIDHGNGVTTLYAHLSTSNVTAGQTVGQGQTIGGAGHTGVATGDHLHYEVRVNGQNVDPASYYTGLDYSYLNGTYGR